MSRIAVVQFQVSQRKQENLESATQYIQEAKSTGALLVAFPEFLMAYSPGSQNAAELCRLAETLDGDFTSTLRRAAQTAQINLVTTLYEKSKSPDRVYDTALWIDRDGQIVSVYRKLHLYDALGFQESAKLLPGEDLARPIQTDAGTVGLMICYDLRFPELSRILSLLGAEILVSPSAWVEGEMKLEHWQTMVRARAVENGCFVVAPNQVKNIYIGHSMVVDPFGRILLDMENRQGLQVVEIDAAAVRKVRVKLPLLNNRRKDVYAKYLGS